MQNDKPELTDRQSQFKIWAGNPGSPKESPSIQ